MNKPSLGFPRMHVEAGERRDFTPALFQRIKGSISMPVLLEHGYGNKLGFSQDDYLAVCPDIRFTDYQTVMEADLVTIIRTPGAHDLRLMRKGSILFSMLHYPTHRIRNELLADLGVRGVSMDMVTDESGRRYIEDFSGTARSALRLAFECWWSHEPNRLKNHIHVTILGSGGLGRVAANEAVHHAGASVANTVPVVVRLAGRSVTANELLMRRLMSDTDILVDTTLRHDTSVFIIPNEWLGDLPVNSVIADITADDYDAAAKPVQVKAIEGIPTGNLDQTLFLPDDPTWDLIPAGVSSVHRRPVVSCYSWPGADPLGCVQRYETQLTPFLDYLIHHFHEPLDQQTNNPFAQAIYRGTLDWFHKQEQNQHY